MLHVGMIGYGTIGQDVAEGFANKEAGNVSLKAILIRNPRYIDCPVKDCLVTHDADEFFRQPVDLILELAGHSAVRLYAERALTAGKDFLTVSVGAFCEDELYQKVREAALCTNKRLILPSCAIAGLDRIAAGSVGHLETVKLSTRKPPKAWYGTIAELQVNLSSVTEPVCIFRGSARETARLFPESVNVSAALSLTGIGFDRTEVEVFVDPTIEKITHEITAQGDFGSMTLRVNNTPSHNNPKTGYIVAMSVIKTLRNLSTPFVYGI